MGINQGNWERATKRTCGVWRAGWYVHATRAMQCSECRCACKVQTRKHRQERVERRELRAVGGEGGQPEKV